MVALKIAKEETPITQAAALAVWQFLKSHPYFILFVLLFVRPLYKRYSSPLRQYPGPFLASCTRLWKSEYHAFNGSHVN